MVNREIDPATFAADERAAWDSVARAWRKWWPHIEGGAQPLNDHLVALAGVEPGCRVLDIATGIGEPSITAARIAGPRGHVLACDLSGAMLELARERAASLGLTNMAFARDDAGAADAPPDAADPADAADARFDAAVCRWGLMLMLDPAAALRRVHARLREGAKFATAVWGRPEEVPFIALAGAALRRELDLPAPDPAAPGPFRLGDPAALPALLVEAGFCDVSAAPFTVTMEFESAAQFVAFIHDVSSSANKVLAEATPASRARLLDAIAGEAAPHALPDGRIHFENRALCAVGTRA